MELQLQVFVYIILYHPYLIISDFMSRFHKVPSRAQKILGHVSLLTTAKYTHLTAQNNYNSYTKINQLINNFDINWGGVK